MMSGQRRSKDEITNHEQSVSILFIVANNNDCDPDMQLVFLLFLAIK